MLNTRVSNDTIGSDQRLSRVGGNNCGKESLKKDKLSNRSQQTKVV